MTKSPYSYPKWAEIGFEAIDEARAKRDDRPLREEQKRKLFEGSGRRGGYPTFFVEYLANYRNFLGIRRGEGHPPLPLATEAQGELALELACAAADCEFRCMLVQPIIGINEIEDAAAFMELILCQGGWKP